jgi:GNAT superfamily N-acetyltransferase
LLLAGVSARPRGRALVAATLVTSSCFIAAACLDLGKRSTVCVALPDDAEPRAEGEPDGRSCESVEECWRDPPRLDASYRCERASPLGLRTVDGGRLRYIGILADPNEAGLALALAIPLALALYRRGTSRTGALGRALIVTLLLGALAGTRSRGAFAALVAAMVAYAWQSGVSRRALAALVVAAPLVVGAARSGERAEASTTERLEIWTEGLAMVRSAPLLGVGRGAFIEHHDLTAHDSFLLAAAEDGIVGLTLWSGLMLSASGLGAGRREPADSEDVLRWRRAVRSSLAGLALGSMFLSLNRHALTWVHLDLAAGVLGQPSSPSRGGRLRAASIVLLVGFAALAIVFVATRLPG